MSDSTKPKRGKFIGYGFAALATILIAIYAGPLAAGLFVLFIAGAPLIVVMIGFAALGALSLPRDFSSEFSGMFQDILKLNESHAVTMSTIPPFIYVGYVLAESKTADRLVRFANALLGWMPGGLAVVTIGTCSLFTVFTGASGVTIIALGGVLMPSLVKNGYPKRFAMGLIAGTGSVGLLFPPALPLIIFNAVYGLTTVNNAADAAAWADRQFLFAGIVPGLVLIGMLSAVAIFVAVKRKLPTQKFSARELGVSFLKAAPELLIPFGVVGMLATGVTGPETAASLTVIYVLILELFLLRQITVKQLWTISREALAMTGAIFAIIIGSMVLTNFMVTARVPDILVEWTQANVQSKIMFLLVLNLLLLLIGSVMDIFSAIVVVVPLIAPVAKAYGIDPVHLGIIFLLNLEVGYLHPPVGLNLFLTSVKFDRPITEVMWATVPFLVTMVVALFTITYLPALTIKPERVIAGIKRERREPLNNLSEIAKHALLDVKVAHKEVTLVDASGIPLKNEAGQPIVRMYTECEGLQNQTDKDACQELFNEVTACRPSKDDTKPEQMACANRAIAAWTVDYMNSESRAELNIVVVTEAKLVDAEGAPLKVPVLDAEGSPVTNDEGDEVTRDAVDKTNAPIVMKLERCAKITGLERETCRSLFVRPSNCKINPPDPADCIAGGKDAATCTAELTNECVQEQIASWVSEYPEQVPKD